QLSQLDDARVQLAAAAEVHRADAAEQILLRSGGLLQFALIDLDRRGQKLSREALVVTPQQARERRALVARRVAVAGDQVGLRSQRGDPLPVDGAAAVAEKVDRAEQRVPLQDVSVEIRQRWNGIDRHLATRHDRQPEAQLAEAHRLGLEIDAEKRTL